jgi:hypothetical protein
MTLRQHIWNHFVLSGRIEEARNHSEILEIFSEYLMNNSLIPEDHLFGKISNLVAQEKFCDELLLPKIDPKKVNRTIQNFSVKNLISSRKRCGDTIWTIPTRFYEIEIEFEKFGKYKGQRYSLKVFPKNERRMYSTCLYSFWSGVILGCGVDTWDLIFDEGQLTESLNILWKNCNCIHEALDSYFPDNIK